MTKAAKGPAFERWFCEQLSLWWSKGENDDLFWRTAGSGARATTRSKNGKRTKGHYGDITATSPESEPFSRSVLLELKRGYNKVSVQDLLDTRKKAKIPVLDEWLSKTIKCACDNNMPYWMLVLRRDRKEPIVILPRSLSQEFEKTYDVASIKVTIFLRRLGRWAEMEACPLSWFFDTVNPEFFK